MNIHQKLKERRLELGLTMLEVAKKTGVSEATVSRWESGDIANMRRDKIVLLARALNVHPSFIMGENEYDEIDSNVTASSSDIIPFLAHNNPSTNFSRLMSPPANPFDTSTESFVATNNETNMILEYRAHPEKQKAINEILNIKNYSSNNNAALMFALYGEDTEDVTPQMLEEIRAYAQFLKDKKKKG